MGNAVTRAGQGPRAGRISDQEREVLSAPGHWVLGLIASNHSLTHLLVDHIEDTGDVIDVVLMDGIYLWYVDAAHLGVDLGRVNAYLRHGWEADVPGARAAILAFLRRVKTARHEAGPGVSTPGDVAPFLPDVLYAALADA